MKFQNLSVKRLFGRVAIGLALSMSGITIALFFVTKQTAVLLTGGVLLLCALPMAMADEQPDITSWILAKDPAAVSGTVRFWIPFKGSQGMDDMIAEFNQTYPNVKVELTSYNNNSDGNLAVDAALMAGEIDVLASFGLANAYRRWENSLYMELTDYIEKYNINLVDNWGTDVYKYDDTYYTFPCGGLSYYVSINMTDWNEAGLGELPTEWTWDEYLAACAAMTKKDERATPCSTAAPTITASTTSPMYGTRCTATISISARTACPTSPIR